MFFVLVHGAWQTAATWDLLAPKLREAGHVVHIPLLRGLENDSNVLSGDVGLKTHIQDVVNLLRQRDLRHVILVGHSYAGMIISGVAEQAAERLDRLVYVDAFVPLDGQSALDLMPAPIVARFKDAARGSKEGWRLPAGEAQLDLWGLKAGAARDFVRARLSDFSIRCFEEPISLPSRAASKFHRTYVASVGEGYPARGVFQRFGDMAKRDGWDYYELPTGHDCHVEMPDALASRLLASRASG